MSIRASSSKHKLQKLAKKESRTDMERTAFNRQIFERIKQGHIPDLRRTKKCDYFFNNPWRHPEYVKLDFKEQFDVISKAIKDYAPSKNRNMEILEVGCGSGYLCLELARQGYAVTGMDLSSNCIEIAQRFAKSDPWKKKRGELEYICRDFFSYARTCKKEYDVIVFLGALHHFKNQNAIMNNVTKLLKKRGIIIVHEPTRDRITEGNAAFVHLLELLLSIGSGFYLKLDVPKNIDKYKDEVKRLYFRLKYEDEKGNKSQSVNDNEAGHKQMYRALKKNFEELQYDERYAFFHDIIGGLRFDEKTNVTLARYLRDADHYLCSLNVLQSTEFFFVGRKRIHKII